MWMGKVLLPTKREVQICIVHLRPPLYNLGYDWGVMSPHHTNQFRLAEVKYLVHHLLGSSLPIIITGDFNENDGGGTLGYLTNDGSGKGIGVTAVGDLWRWTTGNQKTKYEHALSELRFRDAVRDCVDGDIETHRWPLPKGMLLRSRLDHIVYTADRVECVECCVIPGHEDASDHMPVFSLFSLRTREADKTDGTSVDFP